jgi:hypothetical protein
VVSLRALRPSAYASLLAIGALAVGAMTASFACVDTAHDDQVKALGPEQPGVAPGPDHRPGQPCITCHGGSGPATLQLSVGGTVYQYRDDTSQPAVNALVQIEDVTGKTWTVKTNTVGNFFVTEADFQPHYPTQMSVTSADGANSQQMGTLANRDGSCADCHTPSPGPTSPGPVFVALSPDGGP